MMGGVIGLLGFLAVLRAPALDVAANGRNTDRGGDGRRGPDRLVPARGRPHRQPPRVGDPAASWRRSGSRWRARRRCSASASAASARSPRGSRRPELRRYYSAQNAHNQVIQLLGELGVPGAALFLAVLAFSLAPGWRGPDPTLPVTLRGAVVFGILGWLLASLLMHPLLSAEVSAAFWLALGLARAAVAPAQPHSRIRLVAVIPAIVAIVMVVTLPGRVDRVAPYDQPGRRWHRGVTVAARCPGGYPLSHRQGIVGDLRGWPTGAASTAPSHDTSRSRDNPRRSLAGWPPGRTSGPAVRCLDRACRCFFRRRRLTVRDSAALIFAGRAERRRGSISGGSATSTTPVRLPHSESEGDSRA